MINLTFNLTTGVVKLAQAATIKLGADVPVRVTFDVPPGDVTTLQLALGTNDAAADVLAFTEDFTAENDRVWSALLDASDTRLAEFMTGQTATGVIAELVVILDGARQVKANVSVTVQPAVITGPEASEGGPTYYTDAQTDAAITAAIAAALAGLVLTIADDSNANTYRLVSNNGVLGLELVP